MSAQQPIISSAGSALPSDYASINSTKGTEDKKLPDSETSTIAPELASRPNMRMDAALGDAILRCLRIRKGPKSDQYDLDAVCSHGR